MGIADSQTVTEYKKMIGKRYRHFKGGIYIVSDIAVCCDTEQTLVVYKSCDNPSLKWVRPLKTFLSEVDHEKYPDVKQIMRFEEIPDEAENEMSITEYEKNIKQAIRCVVGACDETCYHWSSGGCRGYEEVAKGLEKALEEIQQYRVIGTVEDITDGIKQSEEEFNMLTEYLKIGTIEEFKALKEKATPKKLEIEKFWGYDDLMCPNCKSYKIRNPKYCCDCGQKLDWQ